MEYPHCKQEIPTTVLAAQMGKIGGSRTSVAKKISSRENGRLGGKLGGRPKKKAKHQLGEITGLPEVGTSNKP